MFQRLVKRVALLAAVSVFTLLGVRAFDAQRGPELEPWHTYRPSVVPVWTGTTIVFFRVASGEP